VGGSDPGEQAEVHRLPLEAGDRLLLCSDGLTEMVCEDEILALLGGAADPAAACDRLVERANDHGGRDNVTAVVTFLGSYGSVN
jgi:protein phosphatase